MNYSFSLATGELTLDGFRIHHGLKDYAFENKDLVERWGDYRESNYYVLKTRLIITRGMLGELNINRDAPPGEEYPASVLTDLKNDLIPSGETKFDWGEVSIPGVVPQDAGLILRYQAGGY